MLVGVVRWRVIKARCCDVPGRSSVKVLSTSTSYAWVWSQRPNECTSVRNAVFSKQKDVACSSCSRPLLHHAACIGSALGVRTRCIGKAGGFCPGI